MDGIHGLAGEETWRSAHGRDTRRWLRQTWLMEALLAPVEMAGTVGVGGAGIDQRGQQVERACTRRVHQFVAGLTALLVIAAVFVFAKTPIFQDNIPHRTAVIKAVVISASAFASGSADRAVSLWGLADQPNPGPSPPVPCGPSGCHWP
jgi:hypothetical protein